MASVFTDEMELHADVFDDMLKQESPESPCKEDLTKMLATSWIGEAKLKLEHEIKLLCDKIIPKGDSNVAASGASGPSVVEEIDESSMDAVDRLRHKKMKEARQQEELMSPSTAEAHSGDPVKDEVSLFFGQRFNLFPWVPTDVQRSIGSTSMSFNQNMDTCIKHFDIMKWWEDFGKTQFKLIYPVACRILALPDSNGHQERTFSAATWMDGKLNSRQSEMTFQMKVMLYKNQQFLEKYRHIVEDADRRHAAQKTKDLLKQSLSSVRNSRSASQANEWGIVNPDEVDGDSSLLDGFDEDDDDIDDSS
jgi:hypothetical protein